MHQCTQNSHGNKQKSEGRTLDEARGRGGGEGNELAFRGNPPGDPTLPLELAAIVREQLPLCVSAFVGVIAPQPCGTVRVVPTATPKHEAGGGRRIWHGAVRTAKLSRMLDSVPCWPAQEGTWEWCPFEALDAVAGQVGKARRIRDSE